MPFFARPDLSNEQFKQLTGSTLTLSGETQIHNPTGLTLSDGVGGYVPVIATGGTNNDVLTYLDGRIQLTDASGSAGIYAGASPTTCTVGGLNTGSAIIGCTISCILQDILVPTLYPSFISPSSSFTISPNILSYEVGSVVDIEGTTTFNLGCIDPAYGTTGFRSGDAEEYEYTIWGSPQSISSASGSNIIDIDPHSIVYGDNSISSRVVYGEGPQPKDSCGNNYLTPLPSGNTTYDTYKISGIFPYFYGTYASGGGVAGQNRPPASSALIIGGTKVVSNSNSTLTIDFSSTSDDYIWFAIPSSSINKTKWYVDALNNGNIGGVVSPGGNLFPDYDIVGGVTTACWDGQSYNVYISNYQASAGVIELRNS